MSGPFFCYLRMLCKFEKIVLDYITANRLIPPDAEILLAVSGGADSIALLHCLNNLKNQKALKIRLVCAHLNHQLRAEHSDADEKFVITQAENLGIEVITRKLNVTEFSQSDKLSIETAARQLRIDSLIDIASKTGCKFIASGHQKNDNAETIVHRLLRGCGFRGLGGIWPLRSFGNITFIRPLLDVNRDEIVNYLKKLGLNWRLDATNDQCIYKRNFIRHRLIPEIQKNSNSSIINQLSELSAAAYKLNLQAQKLADVIWTEIVKSDVGTLTMDIHKFLSQPPLVQMEIIHRSLAGLNIGERNFTEQHYKNILQLAQINQSSKIIELPENLKAYRQYDKLIFTINPAKTIRQTQKSIQINIPGESQFAEFNIKAAIIDFNAADFEKFKKTKNNCIEWFDLDKLFLPLTVRTRRQGDRFIPLGLKKEKKIGQFLTDAKIPPEVRNQLFVIADTQKIIWLCPLRASDSTKITEKTKNILQLIVAKKT